MITSDQLQKLYEQVTQRIVSSQGGSWGNREKSHLNHRPNVKDKAYLITQKLSSQQTTRKLDYDKVRTSWIPKVAGPGKFKLQLYADGKIHSGVHTPSFESPDLGTPLLTTFHSKVEEEDEVEVEEILERRGQRYLIKWKCYPHLENTWEPIHILGNCQMNLRQFRRTAASRRRRAAESSRSTP